MFSQLSKLNQEQKCTISFIAHGFVVSTNEHLKANQSTLFDMTWWVVMATVRIFLLSALLINSLATNMAVWPSLHARLMKTGIEEEGD